MSKPVLKIALGGLLLIGISIGFRVATAKPNLDPRNYEVLYQKPVGWQELPKNPNTLLLTRDPKSLDLLRCSATQVVAEVNAEPDMDAAALVKRFVQTAKENQPEWKTERLKSYHNGKVNFEIFRKVGKDKTVVNAMAVRGNTTLLVSLSNSGLGAKKLAESHASLLEFLGTVDLKVTDKWDRIHDRLEKF